jgi:hypothetical protein
VKAKYSSEMSADFKQTYNNIFQKIEFFITTAVSLGSLALDTSELKVNK